MEQSENEFASRATATGPDPAHPHVPADLALDLTRDGAEPGLTSAKLIQPWTPDPADSVPPADPRTRHDGWNPAKERRFLATLADTGVVADGCRACGMSRNAAYERRRSASGRAFALGWDAAILIARAAVSDDVLSRARHGVIDRVYRGGELVAERHRYDNRLTMAVLSRLDRLADGIGEGAPVARAIAQEFDRFLDLLPEGIGGAEKFVSARFPACDGKPLEVHEPPAVDGGKPVTGTEEALLARLSAYREHGVGLPAETDHDELDPAEMERWTDEQWQRAEFADLLRMLHPSEWPDSARDGSRDGTDGMCKLRKLYLRFHPEAPAPEEEDFDGLSVWEDDDGRWLTDFPPPDGFRGWQEGEPDDDYYRRELTDAEAARLGLDEAGLAAEQAERLAAQCAARDRYFGFADLYPPLDSEGRGTARSAVEGPLAAEEPPPPADGRSPSPASAGEDIGER